MANSEGKSLGSEIEAEGAEDEGEFEPLKTLAELKAAMEESIEQLEKESPKGDAPIDIQTSLKGLIVNIDGDYSFKSGDAKLKSELKKFPSMFLTAVDAEESTSISSIATVKLGLKNTF